VSLGVVPDYATEDVKGVRISGTSPGSPAEAAGLRDGDVIVKFGDAAIDSLYDLTDALKRGKAGETVKLELIRDGQRVEAEATLVERKG
jgi:S1-C subfamily serine protease